MPSSPIRCLDTEARIKRASTAVEYDMDSDDEDWLAHYNYTRDKRRYVQLFSVDLVLSWLRPQIS
jgi:hypothetical protein